MTGGDSAVPEKSTDLYFSTPLRTHEAVLAAATRLVSDHPFGADAETTITHRSFSGTYALHNASLRNAPVSVVRITDFRRGTDDAWAALRTDRGLREALGPDELPVTDTPGPDAFPDGFSNAFPAAVTHRVRRPTRVTDGDMRRDVDVHADEDEDEDTKADTDVNVDGNRNRDRNRNKKKHEEKDEEKDKPGDGDTNGMQNTDNDTDTDANASETWYVLCTNEKVRVYGYEDDAVVALLAAWMDTMVAG